jgi:hypothetical protein
MIEQIYDESDFNDRVLRDTCYSLRTRASHSNGFDEVREFIDRICIWRNPGTISKVKFILWKTIKNNGAITLKGYSYSLKPSALKEAYNTVVSKEEQFFKSYAKGN